MPKSKPTIGIIGAGRLGTALARALSNNGYHVVISNSRGADSLILQLQILLPKVTAMNNEQLVDASDIIILAVPLRKYTELPLVKINDKIVIDAMNYWASIDGKIPQFEQYAGSSSELVAQSILGANIVKTFNTVAYSELEEHGLPIGNQGRRAIPLAGDNEAANEVVSKIIEAIGFDAVFAGGLANGKLFQPDTVLFNQRLSKIQMTALL